MPGIKSNFPTPVADPAACLLPFAGVVTALPLLLFAFAARRITLTTLGLLQYIAPTLQFLLGVFVYAEILTKSRMVGFVAIWIALFIYSIEGIIKGKRIKGILVQSRNGLLSRPFLCISGGEHDKGEAGRED